MNELSWKSESFFFRYIYRVSELFTVAFAFLVKIKITLLWESRFVELDFPSAKLKFDHRKHVLWSIGAYSMASGAAMKFQVLLLGGCCQSDSSVFDTFDDSSIF